MLAQKTDQIIFSVSILIPGQNSTDTGGQFPFGANIIKTL